MADASIPKFKNYTEGEPIPPVDPEDIKRMWEYERTHTKVNSIGWQWLQGLKAALSPEAEFSDVSSRHGMIETLARYNKGQLLAPWHQGEELHEAVFRIAATFPFRCLKYKSYKIPGDEHFGFDPNAFVQRLIEETGISHVWEPVRTKVAEGGRCFVTMRIPSRDPNPRERVQLPERDAKHGARQVLWEIWKRFSPSLDEVVFHSEKEQAIQIVATFFANFLLDNIDLVRQLEDAFMDMQHIPLDPILSELERRAQRFPR
jgi:hypothetical protein